MTPARDRSARRLATLAAIAALAGCATAESSAERMTRAAREAAALELAQAQAVLGPPIALGDQLLNDAAVYIAFTREMALLRGGFESPQAIRDALLRGAAYDPDRLSRGLVAYAALIALQSPEFVEGVRLWVHRPADREDMIQRILADSRYAALLPGADAAAARIMDTLDQDIDALGVAGASIEQDAYDIQMLDDSRRGWALVHQRDLVERLEAVRAASGRVAEPSPALVANLRNAALGQTPVKVGSTRTRPPPHPAAIEMGLALAALAALGESRPERTRLMQEEPVSRGCMESSRLNLLQCLAASRPAYEDIYCLGRHVVRDLATCTRGAAKPAPVVVVGPPVAVEAESTPAATTGSEPRLMMTPKPVRPPSARSGQGLSATERLNQEPAASLVPTPTKM